jgi:hypothetical protein
VLLEARALQLSDIPATVWLLLSRPRTVDELVAGAQANHGEHRDAREIVEAAVSALVEQGLAARGSLA